MRPVGAFVEDRPVEVEAKRRVAVREPVEVLARGHLEVVGAGDRQVELRRCR